MAWRIEGRYFENGSCELVCPCTASLALVADSSRTAFGISFQNAGKSGFSTRFAWGA